MRLLHPLTGVERVAHPFQDREPIAARRVSKAAAPVATATPNVPAGLARILRPQAASRWMLPALASITPQYIELILRGALAGSHAQAWELFDLMEDTWPRLRKNALELKNAVRGRSRVFQPWCEEDEEPTPTAQEKAKLVSAALRGMRPDPAADENALDDLLFDLLDAWFKGVSVQEIDWHARDAGRLGRIVAPRATFWVDPGNYGWREGRLGLRAELLRGGATGGIVDFPPDKFLVAIAKTKSGSPLGGALLRPLAWWWCASNFTADWLLNFAQIFGLPFRWGNYDPNAPQATIDAICSMLQNMGSAGWAAFPAGTTLELKEAHGGGDHSPQGDLLDRADKQCDLLVLGQTLTSDTGDQGKGGGSYAAAKVHAGVKAEIVDAVANFAESVINTQLIPSIVRLNYGDESECPTLELATEEEADLQAEANTIATLAGAGAGTIIGLNWLGKRFGIPKPAEGEQTLTDGKKEAPVLRRQQEFYKFRKSFDAQAEPGKEDTGAEEPPAQARYMAGFLRQLAGIKDEALFARALADAAALVAKGAEDSDLLGILEK